MIHFSEIWFWVLLMALPTTLPYSTYLLPLLYTKLHTTAKLVSLSFPEYPMDTHADCHFVNSILWSERFLIPFPIAMSCSYFKAPLNFQLFHEFLLSHISFK